SGAGGRFRGARGRDRPGGEHRQRQRAAPALRDPPQQPGARSPRVPALSAPSGPPCDAHPSEDDAAVPELDLRDYIRDVPDFPKPGILFRDLTPLLADPRALAAAIAELAAPFRDAGV